MRRRRFCTTAVALVGCTSDEPETTPTDGTTKSPSTSSDTRTPTESGPTTEPPTETPTPGGSPANVHQVGEQFTGPLDAIGWRASDPRTPGSLGDTAAEGKFVVVYLAADELFGETVTVDREVIRLVDAKDNTYAVDSAGMGAVGDPFEFTELYPGTGTEGNLVFDVPGDATGLRLRIGKTNIHYVDLNLDDA
jgi:hypothetical protein